MEEGEGDGEVGREEERERGLAACGAAPQTTVHRPSRARVPAARLPLLLFPFLSTRSAGV
eukprot:2930068-Rhodomonas_salina.2